MNFFSKSEWMAPAAFTAVAVHRDGPGAHFGFARRQERHQPQQRVGRRDQPLQAGFLQPVAGQVLAALPPAGVRPVRLRSCRTPRPPPSGRPASGPSRYSASISCSRGRRPPRPCSARTASASARGTGSRGCASRRSASSFSSRSGWSASSVALARCSSSNSRSSSGFLIFLRSLSRRSRRFSTTTRSLRISSIFDVFQVAQRIDRALFVRHRVALEQPQHVGQGVRHAQAGQIARVAQRSPSRWPASPGTRRWRA